MLSFLRSAAGTWVAKGLLSLLVVSFAVWGISGQLHQGFGAGQYVLTAGGTQVSAERIQAGLRPAAFGDVAAARPAPHARPGAHLRGRPAGLSQLLAGAVLDEQARAMRLGLSKDELATLTREDPAFHGPDGQIS